MSVTIKRLLALSVSAATSGLAVYLFVRFVAYDGNDGLDFSRTLLIGLSTFWLAWGTATATIGLVSRRNRPLRLPDEVPLASRVVVLVPVYNEDPVATFSRIAAMDASIAALGMQDHFHFAVLSDTRTNEVAQQESLWFSRLITERNGYGRMFYRRRLQNVGKKAGNIEEFIVRSGGAYDYAMILDADSLMEGATIVEMARRMQADPDLALLQSLPRIINARSFFGRSMQFCANYYSPVFSRGVAALQGREGPFWGHNAMIRVTAFAASCGLPVLTGKPPFGGHILSHDYVEAALLARAGWTVRLDTDLEGSYEEAPENLIEYAKRDRRWCQGNLQHSRLLGAPGLRWWSRYVFLQGIMAYLASPIWLFFLATSIAAAALSRQVLYPGFYLLPPQYYETASWAGISLMAGVMSLLIVPKILIVLRGLLTGDNRSFGGNVRVVPTALAEIAFSSLIAPIMLCLQSRAVVQVLLGLDGGWPATRRSEGRLALSDAWAASYWITLIGLAALGLATLFAPTIATWILPVSLPMIAAPLVVELSSRSGRTPPPHFLFCTPAELHPSPVLVERERILRDWTGGAAVTSPPREPLPQEGLVHVDA